MKRRPKPQRRKREKRERRVHLKRMGPARLYRVYPQPGRREVVEVHLSRTRHQMRETTGRFGERRCVKTEGCVLWLWSRVTREHRAIAENGRVVARMFLNVKDLYRQPANLMAHESGHAALAWARYRRVDLSTIEGEEVVCYALGELMQQINHAMQAHGVWR